MRILVDVCIREVCESKGMIDDKRRFVIRMSRYLLSRFSMNISVTIVERKLKMYATHLSWSRETGFKKEARYSKFESRRKKTIFPFFPLHFSTLPSSLSSQAFLYFIRMVSNKLKSTKLKYFDVSSSKE